MQFVSVLPVTNLQDLCRSPPASTSFGEDEENACFSDFYASHGRRVRGKVRPGRNQGIPGVSKDVQLAVKALTVRQSQNSVVCTACTEAPVQLLKGF